MTQTPRSPHETPQLPADGPADDVTDVPFTFTPPAITPVRAPEPLTTPATPAAHAATLSAPSRSALSPVAPVDAQPEETGVLGAHPKRGRGRPRKHPRPDAEALAQAAAAAGADIGPPAPKRGRGRPRSAPPLAQAYREAQPALPPVRTPGPRTLSPREYLGLDHFAFYRGYLEGLALEVIAEQYLETGLDLRMARTTLSWVRARLIAGARREEDRAAVRLLAIERERLAPSADATPAGEGGATPAAAQLPPSLEEFAEAHDPYEVYSQEDLLALYRQTYPNEGASKADLRRAERNERLREQQIRALFRLQQLLATKPKPEHHVAGWFHPAIGERLEAAGIYTVVDLVSFIERWGKRWHTRVTRLGPATAERILVWLKDNAATLGREIDPRALVPRRSVAPTVLRSLTVHTNTIAPLEYLAVPTELSGECGLNRYHGDLNCSIGANDDLTAIRTWLSLFPNEGLGNTAVTYRGHVERFYNWVLNDRQKAFSDVTVEDVVLYRAFLANPQPAARWINPKRGVPRHSPDWRPFSGPVTDVTVRQAMTALSSLCGWLNTMHYLGSNPFAGVPKPKASGRAGKMDVDRSLSRAQWQAVRDYLATLPQSHPAVIRKQFLVRYAYATGKRLSEIAAARVGDLRMKALTEGECLVLSVFGKGQKLREIELAPAARELIVGYLVSRGYSDDITQIPPEAPIVGRLVLDAQKPYGVDTYEKGWDPVAEAVVIASPLDDDRVAVILKDVFAEAADYIEPTSPADAARLREATPHWMRHTFGTRTAERLHGQEDLTVLRDLMGHASIATTNQYLHTDADRRARGMAIAVTAEDLA
ncbi:phage integrase family protein [Pandoraea sp. NPDC090278]|uniref:phage integrase family protein n=1 Tax=Pandoraea sp. NPDC090278 TaxID=3364391 RepID=UPI003839FBCB